MKNFILFLMMLMVPQVFAQTTPNTQAYFEFLNSPVNTVRNPHARLNVINTAVGGSASRGRASGSDELGGLASHTCSLTAVNSYCELTLKPAVAPYNSANARCEASIWFNGAGANIAALSYTPPGGSEILVPLKSVTGTDYASGYTELACAAGQGVWRLKQITAGTTGTIKYGGYYGPSTRTGKQSDTNTFTAKVSSTGVVTDETGNDWINGNCVATGPGYVTCNFKSSFFTQSPTCIATTSNSQYFTQSIVVSAVSTGAVQFTAGAGNSGTGVGAAYAFNLSCTKTDPASQYTVATVDNQSTGLTLFTPVLSTGAFNPSATSNKFTYTLSGPYMFIDVDYVSAAAGTTGSGLYQLTLPGGYEISPVANNTAASATNFGTGYAFDGANERTIFVRGNTATQLAFAFPSSPTVVQNLTSTNFPLGNTNIRFAFTARVPIKGRENAIPSGLINIDVPVFVPYRYTSGSGNIVIPTGGRMIIAKVLGGGGGGSGSGLTAGTSATAGASTSVGSLVANGGAPGLWGTNVPAGGSCNFGAGWTIIRSVQGGKGYVSSDNIRQPGAAGGDSFLGSGGPGGPRQSTGYNPNPNSGAGGGGGGSGINGAPYPGVGGAAGAYCEAYKMVTPGESIAWAVGTYGNGGGPGSEGAGGGTGGDGLIELEVHYTNFTPALASGLLQRLSGAVVQDGSSPDFISRFTMTFACSSSPCALQSSKNVSSVTRSATGQFTVNFTTPYVGSYPNAFCIVGGNTSAMSFKDAPNLGTYGIGISFNNGVRVDQPFDCTFIGTR